MERGLRQYTTTYDVSSACDTFYRFTSAYSATLLLLLLLCDTSNTGGFGYQTPALHNLSPLDPADKIDKKGRRGEELQKGKDEKKKEP
ncbi:hypothetical protein NQZ68_034098 [Dissostichus eleginoides]|nr:hypothetical protein NQZ68_039813 [Dissostichus eleginoides]KAI9527111.1 hypothetical protein NQZ68_034098 [Dissostichus eleginoides]